MPEPEAITPSGYSYKRDALALLLTKTRFPEKTEREAPIIIAFLKEHGDEYDEYEFSVRVGTPATPDPSHPEGVQRSTVFSSRKRIDMVLHAGDAITIVEVKERITPHVLGQLVTYQHLLMEDRQLTDPPALVAIGRYSDDDTRRVLNVNGVTIYEYPAES